MTLIDDMEATNDVALAVTSALEQVLGEDVILAVGVAQRLAPDQDLLPLGATRAVSLAAHRRASTARSRLIVGDQLATCSKLGPPTSCSRRASRPALEAGATAISGLVADEVHLGRAAEVADRTS